MASVTLAVRVADLSQTVERSKRRIIDLSAAATNLPTSEPEPTGSATGPSLSFGSGPIDRVAQAVARLRGLAFKRGITPEILTDAALRARVEQEFRSEPRAEIDNTDKLLTALGLLQPGDDLHQILLEVQTEQVAGYYDNKARKLVIAGNANDLSPLDRILMAHELTHAITDQHFDLGKLDKLQDQRQDDAALAYLSLVEGDATLMMLLYREEILTAEEKRRVEQESGAQSSSKLDAAPAVIKRSLLFPYDQGAEFAVAVYQRGGTKDLDAAYRNPPTSTEQIMHPQKYFTRDDPQAVALPNLVEALGSGWSQIDRGGVGELDVQIIADQYLPDDDANACAAGWDGGAYVALESSAGVLAALTTVWDSNDEARQAAELLAEWLRPRFGSRGSSYRADGIAGWESPNGTGEVRREGTRVTLVVGPDRASVDRAGDAF